jgi:hypothetical protein
VSTSSQIGVWQLKLNANISIKFSSLKNAVPDNTPSRLKAPERVDHERIDMRPRNYDMRSEEACVHWVKPFMRDQRRAGAAG